MSVAVEGCWEFERLDERTARKDHQCDACEQTIRRGDRYVVHATGYEGTVDNCKRCLRCEMIYQHLCERMLEAGADEWPAKRLDCGHSYEENWSHGPPLFLAELAFLTPDEVQSRHLRQTMTGLLPSQCVEGLRVLYRPRWVDEREYLGTVDRQLLRRVGERLVVRLINMEPAYGLEVRGDPKCTWVAGAALHYLRLAPDDYVPRLVALTEVRPNVDW